MKKYLLLAIAAGLFATAVVAQSVPGFSYQAVARDASGEVIANQKVGIEIGILQGSVTGELLYTEEFYPVTNDFGLINLTIGTGLATSGDFQSIDWSYGAYYVKVSMDETGSSNFELIAISQLLSVPYAMYAQTAESVGDINADDIKSIQEELADIKTQLKSSSMEALGDGSFIDDRDGEIYFEVATTDGKTWMADNLRAEIYTDSTEIVGAVDYEGNPAISAEYGKLYTFDAISQPGKNICPDGYRMPTAQEWEALFIKYGGDAFAGEKLKEAGTDHWSSSNSVTNEAQTSILPSGIVSGDGTSAMLGERAYIWTGELCPGNPNYAVAYQFSAEHNIVIKVNMRKDAGLAIRCVKN